MSQRWHGQRVMCKELLYPKHLEINPSPFCPKGVSMQNRVCSVTLSWWVWVAPGSEWGPFDCPELNFQSTQDYSIVYQYSPFLPSIYYYRPQGVTFQPCSVTRGPFNASFYREGGYHFLPPSHETFREDASRGPRVLKDAPGGPNTFPGMMVMTSQLFSGVVLRRHGLSSLIMVLFLHETSRSLDSHGPMDTLPPC